MEKGRPTSKHRKVTYESAGGTYFKELARIRSEVKATITRRKKALARGCVKILNFAM